jgi:ADP-ribose pyrophosphatase
MPRSETQIKRGFQVRVNTERVTLPNGTRLLLDVVPHPGAAAVVPFVSDDEVLLIRQYRHATGGTLLEVPAGKIDPGENPEQCAARELQEEVGRRAGRLESLGWIWTSPGFTDERIFLFAGFELDTVPSLPADDELIEPVIVPLAEALECVWRGELTDAKSSIALIHAARRLGRLE